MIAKMIDRLLELAQVEELLIGGKRYASRQVFELKDATIAPLTVHSLQAVVDFFDSEENRDIHPGEALIQVVNPYRVDLWHGVANSLSRLREHYLTAECQHAEFSFGKWMPQDEMVINLMTLFEQDDVLRDVLRVVSGLVVAAEATVSDDGISQEVKVRQGVSRVESIAVENPILLRPIRSFIEIEQVQGPHVLRIRSTSNKAPEVAIFEAGGGTWKNEAVARIKTWLGERLPGVKILG